MGSKEKGLINVIDKIASIKKNGKEIYTKEGTKNGSAIQYNLSSKG